MTSRLKFGIIHTYPSFLLGFLFLINILKNTLPKIVFEGVALTQKLSKISLSFQKWFRRVVIVSLVTLTLLGYYPTFSMPPIRLADAKAQGIEQKGEIVSASFSEGLNLPHPGYLSTRFSNYHPAVDIATGLGMPIRPIIKGVVEEAGRDFFGLGNFITIAHEKGFKSKYAHLGKIYAKVGQEVTQENIIGEVGMTGKTSGPHTHLEITHNGNFIDPLTLLPQIPPMPVIGNIAKSNDTTKTKSVVKEKVVSDNLATKAGSVTSGGTVTNGTSAADVVTTGSSLIKGDTVNPLIKGDSVTKK